MDIALWSTYWPGINENICDGGTSRNITATTEYETITSDSLRIYDRPTDDGYTEACYWVVEADPDECYNDDAEILLYLD
jgi:hypothetical protein